MLADIGLHIKSVLESNEYLTEWLPALSPNSKIEYSARHSADKYVFFNAVLPDLPKYFSRIIFTRILRYYKAVEEYDVLLGGFFADVSAWKDEDRNLSAQDISYLSRKAERVTSLGRILTKTKISKLADLPADYEGKIAAKTIIK